MNVHTHSLTGIPDDEAVPLEPTAPRVRLYVRQVPVIGRREGEGGREGGREGRREGGKEGGREREREREKGRERKREIIHVHSCPSSNLSCTIQACTCLSHILYSLRHNYTTGVMFLEHENNDKIMTNK